MKNDDLKKIMNGWKWMGLISALTFLVLFSICVLTGTSDRVTYAVSLILGYSMGQFAPFLELGDRIKEDELDG